MNKREVGSKYERIAAEYLTSHGMTVIEMNYRVRIGEIDIVARDGDYLVFVEVKYRADKEHGGAAYAISETKKRKIYRVAQWYMTYHKIPKDQYCRFDAVLIDNGEITHIKNAW